MATATAVGSLKPEFVPPKIAQNENESDSLLDEDEDDINAGYGSIPYEVKPRIILMGLKR